MFLKLMEELHVSKLKKKWLAHGHSEVCLRLPRDTYMYMYELAAILWRLSELNPEHGTTRLLLTKIPMFQEVVLMSFSCPHCGNENSEIQPGGPIQDLGVRYTFLVNKKESLGRLVVKADSAVVKIPELDFEIPPNTQRGVITTVEGILSRSINDLLKEQPNRKATDSDLAAKLEEFIAKLQGCLCCTSPFSIVLDDPSGNSFIENPLAPDIDPLLTVDKYNRTSQQEIQLGIITNSTEKQSTTASSCNNEECKDGDEAATEDEVMTFHTNCSHCNSPADTRMKLVDIPHFKEVIIMATTCDYCGWKTNEVKSGAGISETGIRINLKLTDPSDLNRDILKAETASIAIPELEFLLESGTLGGRFSTIEGLLQQIKEQLKHAHPFSVGDSSTSSKLSAFLNKLDKVIEGKLLSIHIIMDDPAGNSYVQNMRDVADDGKWRRRAILTGWITAGACFGLFAATIPFILPAMRKYCLPYVPATPVQIRTILSVLKGRSGKVIDLGSGDGRVVIAAARQGHYAVGYELNLWLVLYSRWKALTRGVHKRTEFHRKDLWKVDLGGYNNIIVFGVESMMEPLEEKIIRELILDSAGSTGLDPCVITCRFPFPNQKPTHRFEMGGNSVWVYHLGSTITILL